MIDRYEIQEKIGQGGIGAVYRAFDTQLKREVAIKRMLPGENGNSQSSGEAVLKEATTLSALQHPNIITIYDMGIDDEGGFVVMELLKGETLDQVVQRGVLTLKDFSEVVGQTMEALIAAEAAGVLHRDLKPTNVMVSWLPSKKFQVKILDFSLAKFSRTPAPQTIDQGDAIFGSIYFMAPEQFERGNLDRRTDLYSMGCLYYFCLAGRYPFHGESAAQVMASHLQGAVIPLEKVRPDLPSVICQWVMWLINRYASDRPADARDAYENFQQITGRVEVPTGPVILPGGATTAAPLNSTSRRLNVPPPPAPLPTDRVDPVTGLVVNDQATSGLTGITPEGTRKITSGVAKQQRRNVMIYLLVTLGVLMVVAAMIGVRSFIKNNVRQREVERFTALIQQNHTPVGTAADVGILVSFLGRVDGYGTTAKIALGGLKGVSGESKAIEARIVAELVAARMTRVQLGLIEVVEKRGIIRALPEVLQLAQEADDFDVSQRAYEALKTLGDDQTALTLLDWVEKNATVDLPIGLEQALSVLAMQGQSNEALASQIVALVEKKRGKVQFALLRVLGCVGSLPALHVMDACMIDDRPETREKRLAALTGLNKWPYRSADVAKVIMKGFDGDSNERSRALESYLELLSKRGEEPSNDNIFDNLESELPLTEQGYLANIRLRFLTAVQNIRPERGVQYAKQFEANHFSRIVREKAAAVRVSLEPALTEETH